MMHEGPHRGPDHHARQKDQAALERVMHFDRGSPYMDAEMERQVGRHPRASGDPAQGHPLDSRVRGNDHSHMRTVCLHSRVHNTL